MGKRLFLGSLALLTVFGCGGGSGNGGTANVYGINADPNVGNVTITANGSTVLNNVGYGLTSPGFIAVGSGANASVFVTNSAGTQLAGSTLIAGFLTNNYYASIAYGSSSNQSVAILPVDVSEPTSGQARILFANTSVFVPSVDVYVTTQTVTTGLTPTASSIGVFNSGFASEVNNIVPGTYNVFFTQAGTQNIVASESGVTVGTTLAGTGANAITMLAITDAQGTTTPAAQQTLTPIVFNAVAGATPPTNGVRPIVVVGSTVKRAVAP